jgi:hypothetical protein
MMPKKANASFRWMIAASWLLAAVGCGPSLVTVEGKVNLDGAPVDSGTISFAPADGKGQSIGGAIKDGSYRVQAEKPAALGAKNVAITAIRKTGKQIEAGPPAPAGTMVDELLNVSHTGACQIVDGTNQQNFEIKSPGR